MEKFEGFNVVHLYRHPHLMTMPQVNRTSPAPSPHPTSLTPPPREAAEPEELQVVVGNLQENLRSSTLTLWSVGGAPWWPDPESVLRPGEASVLLFLPLHLRLCSTAST